MSTEKRLGPEEIEAKARDWLDQMNLDEKIDQMSGSTPLFSGLIEMLRAYNFRPFPAGENRRLGIPGLQFSDGPRGVVVNHSTCFPVSIARGATWEPELEERVGDAIGVEARSVGANFFGGVCINLLRHPAWGRAQETYGEDPFHLGEMGAALVRGVQRHVMACIKHYAANSMENARFQVDVQISERTLREVYLPHFQRCVDEGVAAVMSAYNQVNGEYCGHNAHLLRDILKNEWGFAGFVMSDFVFGVRDAKAAALGGLDIEMPFPMHFRKRLKPLIEAGEVPEAVVDEAVLRILRQKLRFAQIGEPERYGPQAVVCVEHQALAREVAQKAIVLLKNDPVGKTDKPLLPIDPARVRRIALIGRLITAVNTGDNKGSSHVRPPYVVTPLQGMQAAVQGQIELLVDEGRTVATAITAARRADLAVIVAGYTDRDEGEYMFAVGGDRDTLTLSAHDEALIRAVAAANPHTVVVLIGGGAIVTEAWRDRVAAILMAWYPGMEGGHALADVLFGKVNPGGKLPCIFPKSATQLPFFDKNARRIAYGYDHGYRLLDKNGETPAFPFGFGLSYTTFAFSHLRLDRAEIGPEDMLKVSVEVTNTGRIAGTETVQLYVGYPGSPVDRPVKELKGFAKVKLEPGETQPVAFELPARRLACYDETRQRWVVEPVQHAVFVGPSSAAGDLLRGEFRIR